MRHVRSMPAGVRHTTFAEEAIRKAIHCSKAIAVEVSCALTSGLVERVIHVARCRTQATGARVSNGTLRTGMG